MFKPFVTRAAKCAESTDVSEGTGAAAAPAAGRGQPSHEGAAEGQQDEDTVVFVYCPGSFEPSSSN